MTRRHTPVNGAAGFCMAMLLAAPAFAQPASASGERTLTVSGEGEIRAAPDEAHLSAGVVTQARSAAGALAANTRAMDAVFATLKRLGIPDRAMATSNFSVSPQYAEQRNGNAAQKLSGYQVSNQVEVTVALDWLGPALDALVASGANSLGDIAFTIRDPKPLLDKARAAAMKDAMARAQIYAAAGNLTLGPILSVSEGGAETPRPMFAAMRMAPAPPPPIAGGEESVTANVSVSFEIR